MATAPWDERLDPATAIQAPLDGLRIRMRRYIWREGLSAAVAWLVAAFWVVLAIDWFFEPPAAVRAVLLLAAVSGLVYWIVEWIGRRAFVRVTDADAAAVLERRFPHFNDALLTAVTLTGRAVPDDAPCDGRMLALTCREAARKIEGLDLDVVFDWRRLRRAMLAAALLAAGVALWTVFFPHSAGVFARRMLAFSNEPWPRNTRLSVEGFADNVRKVARGADAEIIAAADASMPVVPETVEVRYRIEGGPRGRAVMERRGRAGGPGRRFQEYVFTFRGVMADIRFDLVGGDDRIRDLRIEAVDSPALAETYLDYETPAYIGRGRQRLPVTAVMQLPMGSRATLHAERANKELVRVLVAGAVGDRPMPARTIEGKELSPNRRGFSLALPRLMKDTVLSFTLTDSDGVKNRDPIRLTLLPVADRPPQVAVQLDGIGSAIAPRARIPVVGRITDDHGLGRAWFEYAVDGQPPAERAIAAPADRPVDWTLPEAALDAADLNLTPGQKLLVGVKAADLCDLDGRPNAAGGDPWLLEVVAPERLRAILDASELLLRQRFEQIQRQMTAIRDALAKPMGPARVQSALTDCRKDSQEVLGVAEGFDDIRKQFINNRIDTEELKSRLKTGIADPLRAIGGTMYPELDRLLQAVPTGAESETDAAPRDRARRQADAILAAMRQVLDRMLEMEDFNQAVELLRKIIESQVDLRARTERRHKRRALELLRDAQEPKQPGADAPSDAETESADRLSDEERRVAERYAHFESVLLRLAELGAGSDPRRAALLKNTVKRGKDLHVGMLFERIVEQLGKERLSRALEDQAELDRALRAILELLLSDNPEKSLQSRKERLREQLKRLAEIIALQHRIRGRTVAGDDPNRLGGEQRELADRTGKLAGDVRGNGDGGRPSESESGDGRPPQGPAERLDAARERMIEAEDALRKARSDGAVEKEDEALAELEKARAELMEILRQLRREEIDRMLAALDARFRKMLQAQEEVREGTDRLEQTPADQRSRSHEIEAGRLSAREAQIVAEIDNALAILREDGTAAAAMETSGQIRDDMQQIVNRLAQAKTDRITLALEDDVIAALKDVLEALKQARNDLNDANRSPGEQSGGAGGEPPLVDSLAELKMIRALQMRVNARTAHYAQRLEGGEQARDPDLVEALRQLAERQGRIHRVTRDLQLGRNQ